MSRSAKGYDLLTFFLACSIMGALSAIIIPQALGITSFEDFYNEINLGKALGILIAGLAAVGIVSLIRPIPVEKVAIYTAFSLVFIGVWEVITPVFSAIQVQIDQTTGAEYSFPLELIMFLFGFILFIITLFSIGGGDVEH